MTVCLHRGHFKEMTFWVKTKSLNIRFSYDEVFSEGYCKIFSKQSVISSKSNKRLQVRKY
jgi:hypothetical protein